MGGGNWTKTAFESKIRSMGFADEHEMSRSRAQNIYKRHGLAAELNPYNAIRECRDSEEHPETFPIILALDVTGSMGKTASMCAAKLNEIMEHLYGRVRDVEFLMMGIGDLSYDEAPIQATQFESDIRIMDQAEKIWFEGGGGGNRYESYTAAWFFGLHNTDLDCWKRGKKGIIITMGDEALNPYLPGRPLWETVGHAPTEGINKDIETAQLYKEVCEKFDVYHIAITDRGNCYRMYERLIDNSFGQLLGQRLLKGESSDLPRLISRIVDDHLEENEVMQTPSLFADNMIRW